MGGVVEEVRGYDREEEGRYRDAGVAEEGGEGGGVLRSGRLSQALVNVAFVQQRGREESVDVDAGR